jgi:glycosyltransferase involved in cell wall biosynthesis
VTILYVGQLSPHKGVDVLVSAAIQMCRSNENVEFLIAGDYEWKNPFAKILKSDVRAAGLSDRIRFLGYVDSIHELFQIASLHVLPSVFEDPLPNVVIEAKQAGVASVVFPSGGVPEIVVHESEGYVCDDRKEESLIAGIDYYSTSPERARAHGRNAKASLERLGVTRFAELWNGIYADS